MKLISLNIEFDKHLDRIIPFLKEEQPDVVCLQEVLAKDAPRLEEELGMKSLYEPLLLWGGDNLDPWGIALFSKYPLEHQRKDYYWGTPDELHRHILGKSDLVNRCLLSADVIVGETIYGIGTTHFAWSPEGQPTDLQRKQLKALLEILGAFEEIAFCGDFNAPRGGEIFSGIAKEYIDWLPQGYTTSIDPNLHKAGPLPYMVDGLFSTPHYRAENVRLVSGVSDHMAIVAEIVKEKV